MTRAVGVPTDYCPFAAELRAATSESVKTWKKPGTGIRITRKTKTCVLITLSSSGVAAAAQTLLDYFE